MSLYEYMCGSTVWVWCNLAECRSCFGSLAPLFLVAGCLVSSTVFRSKVIFSLSTQKQRRFKNLCQVLSSLLYLSKTNIIMASNRDNSDRVNDAPFQSKIIKKNPLESKIIPIRPPFQRKNDLRETRNTLKGRP